MKLIYRGAIYDYNPSCSPALPPQRTHSYELIYRGNRYRVDPIAIMPVSRKPAAYKLIYRGATYKVNRNEQVI